MLIFASAKGTISPSKKAYSIIDVLTAIPGSW
jgi:hypothetical protein